MRFCFDGQRALVAYQPDGCSEFQPVGARQHLAAAVGGTSSSNGARPAPLPDCGSQTGLSLMVHLLQPIDRSGQADLPGFELQ